MMELVFATNNPNKLKEISVKLGNGFNLLSLQDIEYLAEIPEDYETLHENALQKARTIYSATGKNCFADDTGLEVMALNGRPGVYSARYAGNDCNSEKNIEKLLFEMNGINDREAQFRTVIVLIIDGKEYSFEGIARGNITLDKKGMEGFGYDPVFKPEGFDVTFAEMPLTQKNEISHRAMAFEKMIEFLQFTGN